MEVICKYCKAVHGQLFDVVCPSRTFLFVDAKGEPDDPDHSDRTPQYNFPVVKIEEGKVEVQEWVTPSADQLGNDKLREASVMGYGHRKAWHQKKKAA